MKCELRSVLCLPRFVSMFRPARSQLSRSAALQSRSCFHLAVSVSGSFFALPLFLFVCLRFGGLSRLSPRVPCLRPIFQVGIFYINPLAECITVIFAAQTPFGSRRIFLWRPLFKMGACAAETGWNGFSMRSPLNNGKRIIFWNYLPGKRLNKCPAKCGWWQFGGRVYAFIGRALGIAEFAGAKDRNFLPKRL